MRALRTLPALLGVVIVAILIFTLKPANAQQGEYPIVRIPLSPMVRVCESTQLLQTYIKIAERTEEHLQQFIEMEGCFTIGPFFEGMVKYHSTGWSNFQKYDVLQVTLFMKYANTPPAKVGDFYASGASSLRKILFGNIPVMHH